MKKKRMIILALQLIIILVAGVGVYSFTQNIVDPTEVYVYNREVLDMSQPLTDADIVIKSVPGSVVNEDFARNKDDIIGKFVDGKVKTGQFVYLSSLITLEEVDPFETMDLSAFRKISMPISFVDGFSGNIKRGDKVDLVYTGKGRLSDPASQSEEFQYSKVFLQDVLVYSVNTDDGFRSKDYSSVTPSNITETEMIDSSEIKIITLAVTLNQAEEINARTIAGNVGFLGRFDDSTSYNTLGYVLGDYEKKYSGQASAETGNVMIEEDEFEIVD